jgi:hypothetical protein
MLSIINGTIPIRTKNADIVIKKPVEKKVDKMIPVGVKMIFAITLELCII